MNRRRVAQYLLRGIERYRASEYHRSRAAQCRFSPSCSHFAEDALERMGLPAALTAVTWRVIRCNKLVRLGTSDPLVNGRRLRPNSGATTLRVVFLMSIVLLFLLVASVALGQSISGGCSASINNRAPGTLTEQNPLVVGNGETVSVSGTVPPGADQNSITKITIVLLGDTGVTVKTHAANGPTWGGPANVDEYLKRGAGIYKVRADATGSGWACAADGYIKLDGSRIPAAVAGGVAAVSAGAAFASRGAKHPTSASPDSARPSAEEVKGDWGRSIDSALGYKPDRAANARNDALGCIGFAAGVASFLIFKAINTPVIVPPPAASIAPATKSDRIYVHGHTVAGFFSGLILGLALSIMLQQLGILAFSIWTLVALPVLTALIVAIRARVGRAWRIETGPATTPAPTDGGATGSQ